MTELPKNDPHKPGHGAGAARGNNSGVRGPDGSVRATPLGPGQTVREGGAPRRFRGLPAPAINPALVSNGGRYTP